MARLGDGLRVMVGCITAALVVVVTSFGAGGILVILQLVIMAKLFRHVAGVDVTAIVAGEDRVTIRLTGGQNDLFGVDMTGSGNGFRIGMAGISLAGVSPDTVFSAGCRSGHHAIVPIVAQYLRFTLFGFPAFSALMGLYAGFRTGSFLRCCPLPPVMALGRNGAASLDGGSAILTIKIAGIALFGAGGFGNGRPTVRIVIMAIGSQHTVIWCVAVCLRRPTPITTAGVALFRHRGVCRKAADRNAGTQTQQQAQTCRKFPSSASHRVKPPLFP